MSNHLYDAGAVLMPLASHATSQSFAPLAVNPRKLATTMVALQVTVPPVASATFSLEIASTEAGAYVPINTFTWPAGLVGSKQVGFGVASALAAVRNNTSAWMRLSLSTTGPLTGTAWLAKPTDGGFGLASRSYHLNALNQL